MRLGLYLTGAGRDEVPPHTPYPRQHHPELYDFSWQNGRVLPEYQFLFVHQGRGEFESREQERLELEAGTMILLFPGVWHRYRPLPKTGWTEYWISINGEMLFRLQDRGFLDPKHPVVHPGNPERVIVQYEKIIEFITKHPDRQPASLYARAMMITAEVLDENEQFQTVLPELDEHARDENSVVTQAALQTIWNHSHRKLSVAAIARKIGVTTRTLERHFRSTMGQTVLEHITNCRLDRARRMLCETDLSNKYIAFAAGFISLSHMCKVFQRELSVTRASIAR